MTYPNDVIRRLYDVEQTLLKVSKQQSDLVKLVSDLAEVDKAQLEIMEILRHKLEAKLDALHPTV